MKTIISVIEKTFGARHGATILQCSKAGKNALKNPYFLRKTHFFCKLLILLTFFFNFAKNP